MRKVNKEQQTSTFSGGNGERLNIQKDNGQIIYKKRTLIQKLQELAQEAKQQLL